MQTNFCIKAFALSSMLVLGGCAANLDGAPTDDNIDVSAEELSNALKLTSQDRTNGLNGQLTLRGRSIFFETRREFGAEAAAIEENEGIPVSVRFLDANGRLIFMSVAGHMPSDWTETEAAPTLEQLRGREADLPLVSKAIEALAMRNINPDLAQEREALKGAAISLEEVRRSAPTDMGGEIGVAATSYRQLFSIHRKWLVAPTEHSATRWYNYYYSSGWRYYNTIQYCNHGTCPGGSGMTQKCSVYNGAGSYIGSSQTCDSWTGYALCGAFGGNHNCHDDSAVQKARVVYRRTYSSTPTVCSNWGCSAQAPSCN